MIERKDILSLPYLKKAAFTGSYKGLRFRFMAVKREIKSREGNEKGEEKQILELTAWEGPYGFEATAEEKKQHIEVDFSEEGIQKGIDWLNELWAAEPERWRAAKMKW